MTDREDDHAPMLSGNIELPRFTARSASMSMPPSAIEDTFISHTGSLRIQRAPEISTVRGPLTTNRRHGVTRMQSRLNAVTPEVFGVDDSSYGGDVMRNEHLLMSGPLGLCNNPDCTECPTAYKTKKAFPRSSISLDKKRHNIRDNHSWAEKWVSRLNSYFPIMNPYPFTKVGQQWNQFLKISCLVAIFIDPLFGFLLSVKEQISTLAGNQVPSYFVWEVLFTMTIIGAGLFLFPMLIGNMQNVLQSLGRRRLEMQLRQRDVEQWMSHRQLPEALRRKVRQAEQFTWAATRGINEEQLLENLPQDIQREIHRHFFGFLNKVRIFSLMDEAMLDAIYEKLKQKVYIRGSNIFYKGGPFEKMVFIVHGNLESIGADGNIAPLADGDVCGEELLTWYLEHTSVNRERGRIPFPGPRLLSTRTVCCLTNVEAFALHAADLEEVTTLFSRFLRNPRVQGAIRFESPYWRNMATTHIQVAWRYRQKRLKHASIANNLSANHTA